MPLTFDAWVGSKISAPSRATDAWWRISRNPTTVIFTRPKVNRKDGASTPAAQLAPQVVRIESDNRAAPVLGESGTAPIRQAIVYGICNHPALPDTDMDEGYEFDYEGDHYRCIDVKLVPSGAPGEKQGTFVVNG